MRRITAQNATAGIWLAFLVMPLSGFATDIYLPSLPTMGQQLHANAAHIQLTLTIFLVSYGIGQMFVGSLLDSFGRYKLTLLSLAAFALSSACIAATDSLIMIYAMRAVQGICAAFTVVSKRSFFVDVFAHEPLTLKRYLSLFTIFWSAGPIIAPFLGGYLQEMFGWRANFWFLSGFAAVMLALEGALGGETIVHQYPFNVRDIVKRYIDMLTYGPFIVSLLSLGVGYGMVMLFNMAGPYIIEHTLRHSAVIAGYASLLMGFAWMTGGFIAKYFITAPLRVKHSLAAGFMSVILISFFVINQFFVNIDLNLLAPLLIGAFLIHTAAGLIFNIHFTQALSMFPKQAGIAGGLTGGIAYIITSMFSYTLIKVLPVQTFMQLNINYAIGAGLLILLAVMLTMRLQQAY